MLKEYKELNSLNHKIILINSVLNRSLVIIEAYKKGLFLQPHSMLISIYYMLKNNLEYNDLGSDFYNQFNTQKKANSYIKKLEQLGYTVKVD